MKNPVGRIAIVLWVGVVLSLVSGFGHTSDQPGQMVDSGSWYSREQWPHDGNPHESQNYVVFSDAASQKARQSVAEIGEQLLTELAAEFGIEGDEMFRFPPGQDKIHIFAYKNRYPQAWGARAYYGGLIIWSLDHKKRPTDLDNYSRTIKHELVHVVESLLKGRDVAHTPMEMRVHVWFSEGLAEAVTGGTSGGAIRDLGYMNHLTAKYGKLSPVSFEHDGQVGDWSKRETVLAGYEYQYPMYQLAVEYLLDADGFGKSPQDVVGIFTDMADGSDFPTAFESRLGISLADYEEQFFDLMNDYLPEGLPIRFKRASLAWLVLVAGSLIVLAWSIARGAGTRWGRVFVWVLVTVVFGPLGLLGYFLSYRWPGRQVPGWRRAIGASIYSVTGNAVGLAFLFVSFSFFVPEGDPTDFAILLPFLFGWLLFRAPLIAARSHRPYPVAVLRSLPAEVLSTILVLSGMLTALIQFSENHWWFSLDPGTPLFWLVFSVGAMAGAVIVYPFNLWMVRRGAGPWPGWAT
jgi:hypothetical protein